MPGAEQLSILLYAGILVLVWIPYGLRRKRRHDRNRRILEEARADGLTEPSNLHPAIDPTKCLGCGSCVPACPEKGVLGLIDGKAVLINPANCIGHGTCKIACPLDAITLVLGTETRGVDIPLLTPDFQTNVPGIFVAGELGGMGLIKNAIEQGRQAIDSICSLNRIGEGDHLDVVIVGAGPAGFAASLAAKERGLRCATLEQESLGGTVAHYPRGKIVMTSPAQLPLYGKMKIRETTKESLLDLWQEVERKTGVKINYKERVERVVPVEGGFQVVSTHATYRTKTILLAIGRRGTPRKLDVPGEETTKVVYRLSDPAQYRGKKVLVVGGGDSALEAATSLVEEQGTQTVLSYRGDAFSRAKPANRRKLEATVASGRLRVLLKSNVSEITPSHVHLETEEGIETVENDSVIISAGGILPTSFLESIGIEIETKHGTA